jgi:hypothetical protein
MDSKLMKALEKERESLLSKLNHIEQTILVYKEGRVHETSLGNILSAATMAHKKTLFNTHAAYAYPVHLEKYAGYDTGQPIRDKIITIITAEGRFLHVREIATIAHKLEWHIPIGEFIKKISPALSNLKKIPGSPIVSKVVDKLHFNTFWGSKNWLDENGEIKRDFLFQANQLYGYNKSQCRV